MLVGQQFDDLADVVDEAHVEHAIRFVEHDRLDVREIDMPLVHEVEKASGCCDQDIDTCAESLHLVVLADPAVDHGVLQRELATIGREAVENLHGEFASRAQHDRTRQATLSTLARGLRLADFGSGETVQDRQCEGTGLAGAGLRASQNVATLECCRYGLCLDRRGLDVALRFDRTNDGFRQPEIMESHIGDPLIPVGL